MGTVLFVVGPPGAGKTSAVRLLLDEPPLLSFIASPKWTIGRDTCAAGHYTGGTFDGADTVPYNGVQACLAYWEQQLAGKSLTILDGDRFSNASAVEFFKKTDARLACFHVTASESTLEARRRQRGSKQNAAWVKGRVTKASRFYESFPGLKGESRDAMTVAHVSNSARLLLWG